MITLADLQAHTQELLQALQQRVGPWTPAVILDELTAQVSRLQGRIMRQGQHYPPLQPGQIDVHEEVAAVLFVLMEMAEHYRLDLTDAYLRFLAARQGDVEQQSETTKRFEFEDDLPVCILPSGKATPEQGTQEASTSSTP